MSQLDFLAFDADHHYYEAQDAFTRHVDPRMQKRCMQWAEIGGKQRLLVGGKVNRFIPNPTFHPVAKPGCLDEYFRGSNPDEKSMGQLFGELDPIQAAYRDRAARLDQLDAQRIDGCFLFPTLGVGMEESLKHDPEACLAAFRGFNRWLAEDWGFAHQDRIFAAPYLSLIDAEWAEQEIEWLLSQGARIVCMRPGPIAAPGGYRSPAAPIYDGFWSRVNEAGITVAYHSGDAGYRVMDERWGSEREFRAFGFDPTSLCLSAAPIADTLAAISCQGLFDRHPKLRIATIECGSSWVEPLLKKLRKAYGQMPTAFQSDPVEQFKAHVSVAPYYEDDIPRLRDTLGVERVLFGSDFPHAEGLAVPTDFIHDLKGFDEDEVRLVMRENARGLLV
jgi:predicted TIM-barrel fold metal-dependent hydrolase